MGYISHFLLTSREVYFLELEEYEMLEFFFLIGNQVANEIKKVVF